MNGARSSVCSIFLIISCFHYKLVWCNDNLDLVIIGAGVSGIAAASRLLQNNFTNFLILEGSDRIGGRVNTVPFGGSFVDLGAQWVHGKTNNAAFELAAPLGLLYTFNDYSGDEIYVQTNGVAVSSELVGIFGEVLHLLFFSKHRNETITQNGGSSKSLGDFIVTLYWKKVNPLIASGTVAKKEAEGFLGYLEKVINSMDGSPSWFQTSLLGVAEFVDDDADYVTVWKRGFGYSTVIDLLLKRIPNPSEELPVEERIQLNKEVVKVDWSGSKVKISTADGSTFTAKRVLFTVSLAVLKAEKSSLFSPSLPLSKLNAIEGLGINLMGKIYLEFPYHWLPSGVNGINMVWNADEKDLVPPKYNWSTEVYGFYQSDRLPLTVLCGWVGGEAAKAMEEATDDEVLEQSLLLLKKFSPPNTLIPTPISIVKSSWGKNRFIRGAWSFRHVDSDTLGVGPDDLASPISNSDGQQVLLFAGEASDDAHYGTAHGAIRAGCREADRIISLR